MRTRHAEGDRASVTAYVGIVAALGALAVVGSAILQPGGAVDAEAAAILIGVAIAGSWFPVRFRHRTDTQGFTTEEAAFLGMLFVLPAAWVPLAMTASAAVAHSLRIREPRKVAFNVGQIGLWSSASTLAFHAVQPTESVLSPRSLVAAAVAMIVLNVVSLAAMSELFRRLQGRAYRDTMAEVVRVNLVTAGGNTALGLLFAFTALVDPRATLVASVLLVVSSLGYRGYASAMDERRRNGLLDRVSLTLADVGGSDGSVEAFLAAIGTLFRAGRVQLALAVDDGFRFVEHDGSTATWDVEPDAELARVLGVASRGVVPTGHTSSSDTLAASMIHQGRLVGAISVSGRSGIEVSTESDASLLATLANEAAAVLRNVELFAAVERERGRLAAESSKLGDVVGAASDGIAMIEADGRVSVWNRAMEHTTGIDASTAIGLPWDLAFRARDEDGRELAARDDSVVHRILRGDASATVLDVQLMRRDGDLRWLRCSVSPTSRPGALDGAVIVARDVTREREVAELKGDFVATVSHELRTPLTPLRGFYETLRARRSEMDDAGVDLILQSMGSQLERLERLVGDLLLVADAHQGVLRLARDPVGLREIVLRAVDATAAPDDLDRVVVRPGQEVLALADGGAVERVARALVSNALKHTDGTIDVRVRREGNRAVLEVADQGDGIAPWEHERIFERFARLGDHLHRVQGSGLGLSIARSLARALGGDIEIDSDVGRGAVFRCVLPVSAHEAGGRGPQRPVRAIDSAPGERSDEHAALSEAYTEREIRRFSTGS